MSDRKIIVLMGDPQVGKDTFVKAAVAAGYNPLRFAFADKLKAELARAILAAEGWVSSIGAGYQDAYESLLQDIETNKSLYRKLMQAWGTDYQQVKNPNHYSDELYTFLDNNPDAKLIIITDKRFLHECEDIPDEFDVVYVRVIRQEKKEFIQTVDNVEIKLFEYGDDQPPFTKYSSEKTQHRSDTEMDNYPVDYEIYNDSTEEDYYENVKALLSEIL